jgi:hypothetical protein
MKNYISKLISGMYGMGLLLIILSCNNTSSKTTTINCGGTETKIKHKVKPGSTYQDTLRINFPAAVFYQPDSLQLLKIKSQTDSMIFDGTMHEFFYQMRNARMVMKKNWQDLTITEVKNYRYILFVKNDNTSKCIDLNTIADACGMFVFNKKKDPLPVDMSNIETAVSFYLK